ncbi:MAG: DUF6702 family protein [Bacteroidota bacterium]
MIRYSTILILFLASHIGYGHDIRMAVFEISKDDLGYRLEISLDRSDIMRCLSPSSKHSSSKEDIEASIIGYIQQNFQLVINEDHCLENLPNPSFSYTRDMVRISVQLPMERVNSIETIRVFNTCFIEHIEGHLNIVRANLNGRYRSFKLSSDRVSTVIDYR